MHTTQRLAEFVVGLSYEDVPGEVLDRAKRQSLDVLGVALAASTEQAVTVAQAYVARQRSAAESSVWGARLKASPAESAFANGVAAHAVDFDDVWLPIAHPTAPTFPAALALAEALGASGKDLLVAQVAAYEVMGRLSSAVSGRAGWHPTGVFGCLAAAAGCSKLLGLDERRTAYAMGIASSQASGIGAHSGTMTKPFHAGQAARGGIVAACLAADGFTASDRVLDEGGGFFEAFYRERPYTSWQVTAALGKPFYLVSPGIGLKMYPAGYFMHHTFEAALQLAEEYNVEPAEIREIEIGLPHDRYFNRPRLRSGLDGKFSMQFMAVMGLLDRQLTIESFADERVLSAPVQDLMARTRVRVDPTIPHNNDLVYNPVTVTLASGRQHMAQQALPKSHWRYPLKREEWLGKFRSNAARALPAERVDQVQTTVEGLERVANVRELTALLATP